MMFNWLKKFGLDTVGIGFVMDQVSAFAASVQGQDAVVRGAEYVLLAVVGLTSGELTPEQAKGLILTGVPDLLPLGWVAGFQQSDLAKKPAVISGLAIATGLLGLALGAKKRDDAKTQVLGGMEELFFSDRTVVPLLSPAPDPVPMAQ